MQDWAIAVTVVLSVGAALGLCWYGGRWVYHNWYFYRSVPPGPTETQ